MTSPDIANSAPLDFPELVARHLSVGFPPAQSPPRQRSSEKSQVEFHTPRNLLLALMGKLGCLATMFQWQGEVAAGISLPGFSSQDLQAIDTKLADVLLNLIRLADVCGCDLSSAAMTKLNQTRPTALSSPPPAPGPAPPVPEAVPSGLMSQDVSTPPTPAPSLLPNDSAEMPSAGRQSFHRQVQALQGLANTAQWRLRKLTQDSQCAFCDKWGIDHAQLKDFFKNRKPSKRSLKKPRARTPENSKKRAPKKPGMQRPEQPKKRAPKQSRVQSPEKPEKQARKKPRRQPPDTNTHAEGILHSLATVPEDTAAVVGLSDDAVMSHPAGVSDHIPPAGHEVTDPSIRKSTRQRKARVPE
ncbi:hypothetical protein WJX73_010333 [Symbiochloris irregularis]|uniref:Uncharacterized protein n=1 Tax=Symbiochloris irregularis TaxID=706552 RepID=A0AAW1PG61_9CHLO